MLNLFKKKNKPNDIKIKAAKKSQDTMIYAPVDGQLISIEKVNDQVFSQKMLGDGYAVIPDNGEIVSPVEGEIVTVFPTKHALGIRTEAGDEIILHIGIETVELNGEPFQVYVKEGDIIHPGMKLVDMDLSKLKGKDPTTMVVFSNKDSIETINLENKDKVQSGEVIGKVIH
jgi:glucose-specific phosphotransferase system IIA component